MDQDQDQDEKVVDTRNRPLNLDTVPQDVALVLVSIIKSWSQKWYNQQTFNDRVKAEMFKNENLRAIALSSRNLYEQWLPLLLRDVVLHSCDWISFQAQLQRGGWEYAQHVRTLHFSIAYDERNERQARERRSNAWMMSLWDSPFSLQQVPSNFEEAAISILKQVKDLQVLIIHDPNVRFYFQERVGNNMAPLHFLTHSLKTLSISLHKSDRLSLTAKNALWLLLFCPLIRDAALGFSISRDDYKYLEEGQSSFHGLSKVEKLSLRFRFVFDQENPKSYWGTPSERKQSWKTGNRKSESISMLLSSTKNLVALELSYLKDENRNRGDTSDPYSSCLAGASQSYSTLRHLRIFRITDHVITGLSTDYSVFKSLRIFSFDLSFLAAPPGQPPVKFPSSLEILYLCFHQALTDQMPTVRLREESLLTQFLQSADLKNIKIVAVPAKLRMEDGNGEEAETESCSSKSYQNWKEGRLTLRGDQLFKKGKLKLRRMDNGEEIGDASEGEVFLSGLCSLVP